MPELDLEAEIDLLPTEAGGRRRKIRNGYRPALWFGETSPTGEPALHSALLTLPERDNLAPGERGKVRITPLAWETWPKVDSGTQFDLFDAGRQVGSGSFVSSPWDTASEEQVRRALHSALEEWSSSGSVIELPVALEVAANSVPTFWPGSTTTPVLVTCWLARSSAGVPWPRT